MILDNDRSFLKRASDIAIASIKIGGGPFGAVITKGGEIISEAGNSVVLNHDPTAHAEILAIRKAALVTGSHDLSGCVIYSSCEPCPMCLGAIYWAGIKKVVYASLRTDAAAAGFDDEAIYHEMALDPADRELVFKYMPDCGGENVFRKWDEFEDKIVY